MEDGRNFMMEALQLGIEQKIESESKRRNYEELRNNLELKTKLKEVEQRFNDKIEELYETRRQLDMLHSKEENTRHDITFRCGEAFKSLEGIEELNKRKDIAKVAAIVKSQLTAIKNKVNGLESFDDLMESL